MTIRPLGRFLPVDDDGYLCRDTSQAFIPPTWAGLVDAVVAMYQERCGSRLHSVYLRGSVPRGLAIDEVSDLDSFAVLVDAVWDAEPSWMEDEALRLHAAHPFATGVELCVLGMEQVHDPQHWSGRMIATQALCVHGSDLLHGVPRYRADRSMVTQVQRLATDIEMALGWLADDVEDPKSVCEWIMKRIVRSGLEMRIDQVRVYTRDLWPCFQVFSEAYPERSDQMRTALGMAIAPLDDRARIASVLNTLGRWLVTEIKGCFATSPVATSPPFRHLTRTDSESIRAFLDRCEPFFALMEEEPQVQSVLTDRPPDLNLQDKHVLGLFEHEQLIGLFDVLLGYPDPGVAFIGLFVLDPDRRGRGLGASLYGRLEEWLGEMDIKKVRLGVQMNNPDGRRFWERLGFVHVQDAPLKGAADPAPTVHVLEKERCVG